MIKSTRLSCSFCGKNEDEVLKLVAGPRVYICNECVAIANRLMTSEVDPDKQPAPTIWRRLFAGVRKLFHHGSAQRIDYFNVT